MRTLPLLALLAACSSSPPGPEPSEPGAPAAKTEATAPMGRREDIDVATLASRQAAGGIKIVDVRTAEEYAASHVPGAVNIPLDTLDTRRSELNPTETVHVICQRGGRSSTATDQLIAAGFQHVVNVEGGTAAWIAAGQGVAGGPQPGDAPSAPAAPGVPVVPGVPAGASGGGSEGVGGN